jgi:hypothetical protein
MPKILQNSSKLYILSLLLIISALSSLKAQELLKKAKLVASVGAIVSSDSSTPFLLRSNQYGLVPFESGMGYFNVNLRQNYDSLYTINKKLKRFAYGYGLEVHTNLGRANQLLLPVAHFKVRYGAFEFYAGRRREIQGLVDTLGTMGSFIWSGNALPMPKVEISIPNYTPILGKGLISIKGNFAHGWFGRGDSVQNVLLHQKSFYAKLGKPTWKVHLFGGFNHQVQWGGYPTKPFYDEISNQTISKFGSDFPTFMNVATGLSLPSTGVKWDSVPGIPSAEAGNRIGNHLGTVDIGLYLKLQKASVFIYRQSIYEDGSLFYLNYIADGLLGISYKTDQGIIKKITVEYMNTQSQGGSGSSSNNINELRGGDNYLNNGIYRDSWTYRNKAIGNPLLLTAREIVNSATQNGNSILNNRTRAFHTQISYAFNYLEGLCQILISRNLGTYAQAFDKKQTSIAQKITFRKNNIQWFGILSLDMGSLLPPNFGLHIGAKKRITHLGALSKLW